MGSCPIILHDAIISQIIITDIVFPGVALSGHKCGASSIFSTESAKANLFC